MGLASQINCCLNQNLPNNSPDGYCDIQWCPGTPTCQSFMTSYCVGDALQTPACKQYCQSNLGKCDSALQSYCADPDNYNVPVCGCALPSSQYLFSNLKTPDGESIPVSCDQRCNSSNAIRLLGQQDCEIDAICVVDLNNVNIYELHQEVDPNISIQQNCGSPNQGPIPIPPASPTVSFIEKYWYLIILAILIIISIIVLVVFII